MFGFKRKHNLLKSKILKGKVDIHSHVLPGVDDGSPSMENSLELLNYMEHVMGYREVWLTPHVMQDVKNTPADLRPKADALRKAYKGSLTLHLASEFMMDAGFDERLQSEPLGLGREHLLVETSYMSPPNGLHDILLRVWHKGFRPLIAHPERYMYMDEDDYDELKESGYDFQLNLLSLSGYYGRRPKYVAEWLLEEGMYDFVGSDLHHLDRYSDFLEHLRLTSEQLAAIEELLQNNENV